MVGSVADGHCADVVVVFMMLEPILDNDPWLNIVKVGVLNFDTPALANVSHGQSWKICCDGNQTLGKDDSHHLTLGEELVQWWP